MIFGVVGGVLRVAPVGAAMAQPALPAADADDQPSSSRSCTPSVLGIGPSFIGVIG